MAELPFLFTRVTDYSFDESGNMLAHYIVEGFMREVQGPSKSYAIWFESANGNDKTHETIVNETFGEIALGWFPAETNCDMETVLFREITE